ncbi:ribonuclease E [Buchnera aphidicola]|uniref:ribonuclease E n=1 Tax=Buchnera aphidicola TaxID=9 RepID=UPI003D18BEF8
MKRMLINATQYEELRVALVDGQRLYNLNIENSGYKQKKSNIYKGKITRIEPSLEAVFVDYGTEKHGFLPAREISQEYFKSNFIFNDHINIKNVLQEGQEVIVQINKEERSGKGAALTTFISLAGIYLVLMPNNPNSGGISRRIEGLDRDKLKNILSLLDIPENMSVIIRTAGIGKSITDLKLDLKFRLKHWNEIQRIAKNKMAPFLIHQESNVIVRAFRDYLRPDIGEIIIDNPEILEFSYKHINLLGRLDFINKVKLYNGKTPLFSHYQIESQINSAFQRKVRLPSGGSIIIDTTEALTSIDINSSRYTKGVDIKETAFNTNLEAVNEISRQLILRDLGGLIVIDFIDMTVLKHQKIIEKTLKKIIKNDRARIQIGNISRFGLLEMSRQRLNSSLSESNYHICPRCTGTGAIRDNESLSLSILRLIEEESLKENTCEVHAVVPIEIASYLLNEKRNTINKIQKKQNGGKIIIIPNKSIHTPHYSIIRIKKGEEVKKNSYHLSKINEIDISNYLEKKYIKNKIDLHIFKGHSKLKNKFLIDYYLNIKNIIKVNYFFNKISNITKLILNCFHKKIFYSIFCFINNLYIKYKKKFFNKIKKIIDIIISYVRKKLIKYNISTLDCFFIFKDYFYNIKKIFYKFFDNFYLFKKFYYLKKNIKSIIKVFKKKSLFFLINIKKFFIKQSINIKNDFYKINILNNKYKISYIQSNKSINNLYYMININQNYYLQNFLCKNYQNKFFNLYAQILFVELKLFFLSSNLFSYSIYSLQIELKKIYKKYLVNLNIKYKIKIIKIINHKINNFYKKQIFNYLIIILFLKKNKILNKKPGYNLYKKISKNKFDNEVNKKIYFLKHIKNQSSAPITKIVVLNKNSKLYNKINCLNNISSKIRNNSRVNISNNCLSFSFIKHIHKKYLFI